MANNQLNSNVYTIQPTSYSELLITGVFTGGSIGTNDYSAYINPTTPSIVNDTTLIWAGMFLTINKGIIAEKML